MRAVISVVGKDTVGILAKVSEQCAKSNANIVDVTQTILQDLFVMIMMVDISEISCDFGALSDALSLLGKQDWQYSSCDTPLQPSSVLPM